MTMAADNPGAVYRLKGKWQWIALLCALPLFVLFAWFGEIDRGLAVTFVTLVVFATARVRWDLRKHGWFWAVLSVVGLTEMLLVLMVPWANEPYSSSFVMYPMGIADFVLVYGCVSLVEKVMRRSHGAGSSS
jgi:hypothetical protein